MKFPWSKPSPSDLARKLSNIGHEKRKASFLETAKQIASELGRNDLLKRLQK